MPANSSKSKRSTTVDSATYERTVRSDILVYYGDIARILSRDYKKVEDIYVPRSSGHMAHHSNHNNVKIGDCFKSIGELLSEIVKSTGEDGSFVLGQRLGVWEEAFNKYNDVLKEDYIHYLLLRKAASMGICGVSDDMVVDGEERRIADVSRYALSNIEKLVRMLIGAVRICIEKISDCEKNVSLKSCKSKSVKAQRSASIASAIASASKKQISWQKERIYC